MIEIDKTLEAAVKHFVSAIPLAGVSMKGLWVPGDRVELVRRSVAERAGTVDSIREVLLRHEQLWITFDDGETIGINPDVMRHVR